MVAQRPPSIAREDYLQTIMQLGEEDVPVIRARLAERLHVSAPSVSEAVRSLEDDGLVAIEDRRQINLTGAGQELAENIVRRHRVAERILVDLLGLSWSDAHDEAHRLEHGLSDRVVDAAVKVLGNPTTCPHGSPIPGSGYREPDMIPASELGLDQAFLVERIGEGIEVRPDVLHYLDASGFRPGAKGLVRSVAPDGTISVDIEGSIIAIGPHVAEQIHVSEL